MTKTQTKPRLEGKDKTVMSLRLRPDEARAIAEIARRLNIPNSAVLHIAIAEIARQHGLELGGR